MITFNELLHGHSIADVDIAYQHNLEELLKKMNKVRDLYGKPMIVTSGFRTYQDQMKINPKAPKSKHMIGCAVDIEDKDGSMAIWIKSNIDKMADIGLWFEDFEHTKGWVHFQSVPPASGKRVFIP